MHHYKRIFIGTNRNSKLSGFTIIEVLISVFILSLALTGTYAALTANSNSAASVQNNYVASGLVQEGVELVRNLRDSDFITGRTFGSFGNPNGVAPDGGYRVQWNSTQLMFDLDSHLKFDSGSGIFSYDTGVDSIFTRTVQITTKTPDVEKKVVVTVTWFQRGAAKSLSAEEHLFNWR